MADLLTLQGILWFVNIIVGVIAGEARTIPASPTLTGDATITSRNFQRSPFLPLFMRHLSNFQTLPSHWPVLPISCSYCVTPLLPFLYTWMSPMSPPSSFCLWPLSMGDFRTLDVLFTIHFLGRLCAQHECVFVQRGSDGLNHLHNSDINTPSRPPSKSCRTICCVVRLS